MSPIRIVIADDHPTLRAGIIAILAAEPDLLVVGTAGDGYAAIQQVHDLQPAVLLLDMDLPGLNGVEVARQLRKSAPQTAILALSGHADPTFVQGVLAYGAAGYLTKDESPEQICLAIRAAALGQSGWLSRPIAAILMQMQQVDPPQALAAAQASRLTAREQEVLRLLAQGASNEQIGGELQISAGTVKNHTLNIYAKLGVHTRAEAVTWAWRHNPSLLGPSGKAVLSSK
jgi:DNA-binding NarL/FixJ family response regulator